MEIKTDCGHLIAKVGANESGCIIGMTFFDPELYKLNMSYFNFSGIELVIPVPNLYNPSLTGLSILVNGKVTTVTKVEYQGRNNVVLYTDRRNKITFTHDHNDWVNVVMSCLSDQ